MNEIMSRVRQVPRIRASDISSRKVKGAIEGYLYLAPALIILTIFVFVPIVSSFQMSLTRVAPFGNRTLDVGLGNYERLWNSPEYRNAVKDTLIFALGVVPTSIILSVMLGIALSYPLKHLSWFHRLLIFLPIVLSAAVTGVLFRWVFHPVVGYINYMLDLIGIDGPSWLSTKPWAMGSVVMAVVWRQLGFNTIIALAGLQNIDEVYYEAAKVDGATLWHRIRHITLPLLSPTLFFLFVINVITVLQTFGEIDILTQGTVGTKTMLYSIYFDAFRGTPQRGIASAQAYILFLLIIALSFIQFRVAAKKVHYQ